MLKKRLTPEIISELKLQSALTMLERGLRHTQMVYQGVYAFTNLVKEDSRLDVEQINLSEALEHYLKHTAYFSDVEVRPLGITYVNKSLFCTAIDNFIRNGLKYNESKNKKVCVYSIDNDIFIADNGIGMTQEEFEELSLPFKRKHNLPDGGSGLGLNIALAIIKEHGCQASVVPSDAGTTIKISGISRGPQNDK